MKGAEHLFGAIDLVRSVAVFHHSGSDDDEDDDDNHQTSPIVVLFHIGRIAIAIIARCYEMIQRHIHNKKCQSGDHPQLRNDVRICENGYSYDPDDAEPCEDRFDIYKDY